jgi:hypothetical protein
MQQTFLGHSAPPGYFHSVTDDIAEARDLFRAFRIDFKPLVMHSRGLNLFEELECAAQ